VTRLANKRLAGEILFLPHRLPYPPDRGDRTRAWQVLRRLVQFAPVHVICPNDDMPDPAHQAVVKEITASLTVYPRTRTKTAAMARAILRGTPASVELFQDHRVMDAVKARLQAGNILTIYAHSGQMAAYVPGNFSGRFLMDFVDVDSAKFLALGGANAFEGRRLRAFEIAVARRADATLFVSEAEAALFRRETGLSAHAIDIGVDLEAFDPALTFDAPAQKAEIVFTGQMDYAPNVEAVASFVRDSLPAIRAAHPGARFAIVGRAPTDAVRALASDAVTVTGAVPDTRPWLAAADVIVAPLKLARGVQTKVLEAMAMGKAIVASPQAAEGIRAEPGRDLLVADDPVPAICVLLNDAAARHALGAAARRQAVARYSWEAVTAPLERFVMP
jgi:polysaccharide biosynthesis protein PslH